MTFVGDKMYEMLVNEKLPQVDPLYFGFIPGELMHLIPPNMRTTFDFTTPPGVADSVLMGFLFQLPKWNFTVAKLEESIEISPVHSQYYQLTIQQKQQLENQIKTAVASISTAVSDFELLFHDLRKYKEFMDVFHNLEKSKKEKNEELGIQSEQTLKSIFIDQVDAHTGEGIALRTIAPRWPTIIADFMRLKEDDTDRKNIAKKLNVSEAEGVILSTKNKLFQEWKVYFKENVTGRYQRIKGLTEARKRSIAEYRNMIRPYLARYYAIQELGETEAGRAVLRGVSWFRPAGQAVSIENSEIWAWRPFHPGELTKAPIEARSGEKVSVLNLPFPQQFKDQLKENWNAVEEAGMQEAAVSPNGIEPLDKWVIHFAKKMEKEYSPQKITIIDLLNARQSLIDYYKGAPSLDPYFVVLEMDISKQTFRMANGEEFENITLGNFPIQPFQIVLNTQNVILLRYLEMLLKERKMESYISDFVGETAEGKSISEIIKEEYPLLLGEEEKKKPKKIEWKGGKKLGENIAALKEVTGSIGVKFALARPGPYENTFIDRIASPYLKEMADLIWKPTRKFFFTAFGVPG